MEVREASRVLGVSEEELVEKGVRAYLENELRRINAQINIILTRYDVSSFSELDDKITNGDISETNSFEDYTRLDYLESQREKIEKVLSADS